MQISEDLRAAIYPLSTHRFGMPGGIANLASPLDNNYYTCFAARRFSQHPHFHKP